jgi:tRNA-Thr(GGU) m(6)t(6)A37 methyltransferase TsaA
MAAPRPGEVRLPADPGARDDARLAYIGQLRTPWGPGDTPRNLRAARERGCAGARIELAPGYAPALEGLSVGQAIQVLYWVDRGLRDLAVQVPKHGRRAGTFALRSPVRPNPIALGTVRITALDQVAGLIGIDAIDAWDGTPVLDIKPWLSTVDVPPGWRPEG